MNHPKHLLESKLNFQESPESVSVLSKDESTHSSQGQTFQSSQDRYPNDAYSDHNSFNYQNSSEFKLLPSTQASIQATKFGKSQSQESRNVNTFQRDIQVVFPGRQYGLNTGSSMAQAHQYSSPYSYYPPEQMAVAGQHHIPSQSHTQTQTLQYAYPMDSDLRQHQNQYSQSQYLQKPQPMNVQSRPFYRGSPVILPSAMPEFIFSNPNVPPILPPQQYMLPQRSQQPLIPLAQPVKVSHELHEKNGKPSFVAAHSYVVIMQYKIKYQLTDVNSYTASFCFDYGARFFVIKSFNEENIFKSLVYKVWQSTKEGNERLSSVYQNSIANQSYPIFLFFSLNQSGQFCGVAQLVSDLDSSLPQVQWSQQKHCHGNFKVKWLYVKDIQNKYFKHLQNKLNENKPVTNSRDTCEVSFAEGVQMLEIFRTFNEETSIFNDFPLLEKGEKKSGKKQGPQLMKRANMQLPYQPMVGQHQMFTPDSGYHFQQYPQGNLSQGDCYQPMGNQFYPQNMSFKQAEASSQPTTLHQMQRPEQDSSNDYSIFSSPAPFVEEKDSALSAQMQSLRISFDTDQVRQEEQ